MIYKTISALCRERGVAVTTLEKELGFGKSTIKRWEKSSPTVAKIKAVADYFDVSVDYLVSGEPEAELKGNVTVVVDGQDTCGCSFQSMRGLISLLELFGTSGTLAVYIHKSNGDGASS